MKQPRKIVIIALVSAALITSLGVPSHALDPSGSYNSVTGVVPPTIPSWGLIVDEPLTGGFQTVSSIVAGVPPTYSGKLLDAENRVCKSAGDPHCAGMYNLIAQLMLPPCVDAASRMCVEGLEVSTKGSALTKATLDHTVASEPTPADSTIGLPAGGSPSLWKAPSATHVGGTDTYGVVVNAQYQKMLKVPGIQEGSKLRLISFNASVIPVVMTAQYGNVAEVKEVPQAAGPHMGKYNYTVGMKDGATGPAVQNLKCLWTELALCARISSFAEDSKAALTLRMNNDLTGWLFGRMKEVNVSVSPLDASNNTLKIEAKPVDVPAALGFVAKADIPKYPLVEAFERLNYSPGDGNYERVIANQTSSWGGESSAGGFRGFTAFEQFLKPIQSQGERWLISAGATGNGLVGAAGGCFASTDKLLGLVTTNSLIYSPGPPELKDGALIYKVAGLHTTANGDVFKGTYDLAMRSETARCLYNFTKAPIRAEVVVVSADGSNQNVTTVIQNEKDGWFTLGAYNFTFSQPTIRIKLTQEKAVVTSSATPASVTPAPKASTPGAPANPNKSKTIIITCVKGKTTKKVVGANPTCPAGYKKK